MRNQTNLCEKEGQTLGSTASSRVCSAVPDCWLPPLCPVSFRIPTFSPLLSKFGVVVVVGGGGRMKLRHLKKEQEILDRPRIQTRTVRCDARTPRGGRAGGTGVAGAPPLQLSPESRAPRCAVSTPVRLRPFLSFALRLGLLTLKLSWAPLAGIPRSDFFPPNFTNTVLSPSKPPPAETLRLKQHVQQH